jgi:hypothetical protein
MCEMFVKKFEGQPAVFLQRRFWQKPNFAISETAATTFP